MEVQSSETGSPDLVGQALPAALECLQKAAAAATHDESRRTQLALLREATFTAYRGLDSDAASVDALQARLASLRDERSALQAKTAAQSREIAEYTSARNADATDGLLVRFGMIGSAKDAEAALPAEAERRRERAVINAGLKRRVEHLRARRRALSAFLATPPRRVYDALTVGEKKVKLVMNAYDDPAELREGDIGAGADVDADRSSSANTPDRGRDPRERGLTRDWRDDQSRRPPRRRRNKRDAGAR